MKYKKMRNTKPLFLAFSVSAAIGVFVTVLFLKNKNSVFHSQRVPASISTSHSITGVFELRVAMLHGDTEDHSMHGQLGTPNNDPTYRIQNRMSHGAARYYGVIHTSDGMIEVQANDSIQLRQFPSGSIVSLASSAPERSIGQLPTEVAVNVTQTQGEGLRYSIGDQLYLTSVSKLNDVRYSKSQKIAVVLFENAFEQPKSATTLEAQANYFGQGAESVKSIIERVTKQNITIEGRVFGPLQGPKCWDFWTADGARDMAIQAITRFDPNYQFDTLFLVMPRHSSCLNPNFATVGKFPIAYENGEKNISVSWLNWSPNFNTQYSNNIAVHEFGHNLSLTHSSRLHCEGSLYRQLNECHYDEYWDPHDIMGAGYYIFGGGFSATQFFRLGWLKPTEVVEVNSTQTIEITDSNWSETKGSIKLVRVPINVGRTDILGQGKKEIYIDYVASLNYPKAVFVRAMGPYSNVINLSQSNSELWTSWLENPGDSFNLPESGVKIVLVSRSPKSAFVRIERTPVPVVDFGNGYQVVQMFAGIGNECQSFYVDVKKPAGGADPLPTFTLTNGSERFPLSSLNFHSQALTSDTTRFRFGAKEIDPNQPTHVEVAFPNSHISIARYFPARSCPGVVAAKVNIMSRQPDQQNCSNMRISGTMMGASAGDQLMLGLFNNSIEVTHTAYSSIGASGEFQFVVPNIDPNYFYDFSVFNLTKGFGASGRTIIQKCSQFPVSSLEFQGTKSFEAKSCTHLNVKAMALNGISMSQQFAQIRSYRNYAVQSTCNGAPIITRCCGSYFECHLQTQATTDYLIEAKLGSAKTWGFANTIGCQ